MQEYSSKSLDIITFKFINNDMCPNQKRPIINNYCMYVDYVLHQVYIYLHLHIIPTYIYCINNKTTCIKEGTLVRIAI